MMWVDLWPIVSLMSWIGTPFLHDRHGCVPRLVSVPVAGTGSAGDLAEPPVERVAVILASVLLAEHQVAVLPEFTCGEPFGRLADSVSFER